jgi:hypothetical protein
MKFRRLELGHCKVAEMREGLKRDNWIGWLRESLTERHSSVSVVSRGRLEGIQVDIEFYTSDSMRRLGIGEGAWVTREGDSETGGTVEHEIESTCRSDPSESPLISLQLRRFVSASDTEKPRAVRRANLS